MPALLAATTARAPNLPCLLGPYPGPHTLEPQESIAPKELPSNLLTPQPDLHRAVRPHLDHRPPGPETPAATAGASLLTQ